MSSTSVCSRAALRAIARDADRREAVVLQQLDVARDGGQRRLQLVGDRGDHLALVARRAPGARPPARARAGRGGPGRPRGRSRGRPPGRPRPRPGATPGCPHRAGTPGSRGSRARRRAARGPGCWRRRPSSSRVETVRDSASTMPVGGVAEVGHHARAALGPAAPGDALADARATRSGSSASPTAGSSRVSSRSRSDEVPAVQGGATPSRLGSRRPAPGGVASEALAQRAEALVHDADRGRAPARRSSMIVRVGRGQPDPLPQPVALLRVVDGQAGLHGVHLEDLAADRDPGACRPRGGRR